MFRPMALTVVFALTATLLTLLVLPLLYLMFERKNADRVPGPTAAEELELAGV